MSTDEATTYPIRVTLYTRRDCHLCEEMHAVVTRVAHDIPFTIEHVDVDTDPELAAEYGTEVPVLLVNGRKAFKYRVDEHALRARLTRERQ